MTAIIGVSHRFWQSFLKASKSAKLMTTAGAAIVLILLVFVVLGDYIAPHRADEMLFQKLTPPNAANPFGTDSLGRDVLSRILVGTRASMTVAFFAILISSSIGIALGGFSGYIGGMFDRVLALGFDALYAFPSFLVALTIALALGAGIVNTSLAVSIAQIPVFYRIIRGITLSIKSRDFVEAEKAMGASSLYILSRHIAPFFVSQSFVLISLGTARAIMSVAGLGFLGLGLPPPTPEWGTDLALGRSVFLSGAWWTTLFPGVMIFLSVIGFNMLSEGLNVILNPTRRKIM